ncbi:hypothetical protein PENTCL1PPCAC_2367, partial [Pristionchus entomophagus]
LSPPSPPSTPPPTTTRFPPLPWDSLPSTTTSPDPFGLLSRVKSTPPSTTDIPQLAPSLSSLSLPSERRVDLPQSAPSIPSLPSMESEERLDDTIVPSSPSTCLLTFDDTLRQECITSTWTERFYYDSHEQSCIPFWYDSSCAAKDRKGKNEFVSEGDCMRCKNGFDPMKEFIEITPSLSISLKENNHFTTHPPMETHEMKEEEEVIEEEEGEEGDAEFHRSTSTSTSTPLPHEETKEIEENEEEEKKKVEDAYLSIKNSGSCSGILDTRLEDDCDEGNWEMKYFFSSEKGSCRPFWYGGCSIDVHNFYATLEACKLSCGNHYPVEASHFNQTVQHYVKKEETKEEEKTTTTYPPPTITTPELISWTTKLAPIDIEISGEETTTTSTQSPPTPPPSIPSYTVYPIEHSIKNRGSISYSTTPSPHPAEEIYDDTESPPSIPAGGDTDPCDDPIDPKLEDECTETWEYRSYFDSTAKKCVKFWFGGCEVKSRNLFLTQRACRAVCHHKMVDGTQMTTVSPPTTPPTVPSTTSILPTTSPLSTFPSESSVLSSPPHSHVHSLSTPSNSSPFTPINPSIHEPSLDLPQYGPFTATDPSTDPSLDLSLDPSTDPS